MKAVNILYILASLLPFTLMGLRATGQCTHCQGSISHASQFSSAIGQRTAATGTAAFASGLQTIAAGNFSSSLGSYSNAKGNHAITLGSNINSLAERSVVIGHGAGPSNAERLVNLQPNSMMIGFNSILPTLFIGPSRSANNSGRVGIGNVTEPKAKLHIRSDPGESASLFIEQPGFREADIILGHEDYGIRSTDGQGMIFRSRTNYIFNDGNIGIGTLLPKHALEVHGNTSTEGLVLYDPEQYTEDIRGWVLRTDETGHAYWSDPSQLADNDWIVKDNNAYRIEGNVGLGTSNPVAQLDLADIYTAGGMNLKIGNDTYLSDIDLAHTLGILSQNDPEQASLLLGMQGPQLTGIDKKLGIGTTKPGSTLELNSNIGSGGNVGLCIANGNQFRWFMGMNNEQKFVCDLVIGNYENLGQGSSSFLVIKPDGNVGIGTDDTYAHKLAVNGAILAEEITVNVHENWPDYVFDEDHKILSIGQLENYIARNGHLPEIPDAEEIRLNGLKVGEMERLLLKKVEELTLYIIKQENRIRSLENTIDDQGI